MSIEVSAVGLNAEADATVDQLDGGYVRVYDGARPATVDDAITTQILLLELQFSTPAFGAAGATNPGEAEMSGAISALTSSAGTATWFRVFKSDGTTVVLDGDVTATGGGGDIEFSKVVWVVGEAIELKTLVYKRPG